MSKIKINIWGREFNLNAVLQHFPNEDITKQQEETFEEFSRSEENILKSLPEVEKYVLRNGLKADKVDNIFKYVMPKSILIPRNKKNVAAIMCDFKFDDENGIAVVFEKGKFKKIGQQDIIL